MKLQVFQFKNPTNHWILMTMVIFGGFLFCSTQIIDQQNFSTPPVVNNDDEQLNETSQIALVDVIILRDPDKLHLTIKLEIQRNGKNAREYFKTMPGADIDPGPYRVSGVNIGDIIYFTVESHPSMLITPFEIEYPNQQYQIDIKEIFKDTPAGTKRVPNTFASLSSYDIFSLNPLHIDQTKSEGGGRANQVFEELRDHDVDWHRVRGYGDYCIKNSFNLFFPSIGRGEGETRMAYSFQSFSKSLGVDLGLSAGIADLMSGSIGGGFKSEWGESSGRRNVYTYAKKQVAVYTIGLNNKEAKFTRDFIHDVWSLPIPDTEPQTMEEAKSDMSKFNRYKGFIQNYGTHYPTKVTYGGFLFLYERSTLEKVTRDQSMGIDFKKEASGKIKGIELGSKLGVEYRSNEGTIQETQNSKQGYVYVGGRGNPDNWTVGTEDVKPIKIELERLYKLLDPINFNLYVYEGETRKNEERELRIRRKMLEFALTDHIRASTDAGESLKPRVFELVLDDWVLKKNPWGSGNEENVYGHVRGGLIEAGALKETRVAWSRSDAPGARVLKKQGEKEIFAWVRTPAQRTITVPVESVNGQIPDLGRYMFVINAEFNLWKAIGHHWCLGSGAKIIFFSSLSKQHTRSYTWNLKDDHCNKNGFYNPTDWEIEVNYRAYEKGLESLGFDYFPDFD